MDFYGISCRFVYFIVHVPSRIYLVYYNTAVRRNSILGTTVLVGGTSIYCQHTGANPFSYRCTGSSPSRFPPSTTLASTACTYVYYTYTLSLSTGPYLDLMSSTVHTRWADYQNSRVRTHPTPSSSQLLQQKTQNDTRHQKGRQTRLRTSSFLAGWATAKKNFFRLEKSWSAQRREVHDLLATHEEKKRTQRA